MYVCSGFLDNCCSGMARHSTPYFCICPRTRQLVSSVNVAVIQTMKAVVVSSGSSDVPCASVRPSPPSPSHGPPPSALEWLDSHVVPTCPPRIVPKTPPRGSPGDPGIGKGTDLGKGTDAGDGKRCHNKMVQKKGQANDEDLGKGTNVHMGCGATDLGVSSFATYWEKEEKAVNAATDKMRSDWYNWHKGLHKGYGKAKDEWRRGEWGPLRTK